MASYPWTVTLSWPLMPLVRIPQPFDDPDWLFELKHDGFRAAAVVDGHQCTLVSRWGRPFPQFPQLAEEIAHSVRAHRCVLDGEIVCLRQDGSSDFRSLLFRREWPYYYAFDILSLEGLDTRDQPLARRKQALRRIIPRSPGSSRLRFADSVRGRGKDLYELACGHDAEGIVAKWASGRYLSDGSTTSWLKLKNPDYTQAVGRHELFEGRRAGRRSGRKAYLLDPAVPVRRAERSAGAAVSPASRSGALEESRTLRR